MRSILALAFLFSTLCLAGDDIAAGTYSGKWEGNSGASGDFRITVTGAAGAFKAEVMFTAGGEEVKPKVTSLDITGSKIKLVYAYEIQGNQLESSVEGERKGNALEGKYKARLLPDAGVIDEGAWHATVAQ